LLVALSLTVAAFAAPARVALAAGDVTVRVYTDVNRNGAYNAGVDTLLPGVSVRIYNTDNILRGFVPTNADGLAVFTGLADGSYRVEVEAFAPRVISVGGAANQLVSLVTVSGSSPTLNVGLRTLDAGGSDPAVVDGTRVITSRVWRDLDADGIQDAGEPGIAGVTLGLFNTLTGLQSGSSVASDGAGYVVFPAAPAGSSLVLRVLSGAPADAVLTRPDATDEQANPDQRDSDAFVVAGRTEITVPDGLAGANNDSLDLGYTRGAVSGFVWRDLNRNGSFNAEPFINGITVELVDRDGNPAGTATTRSVLNSPTGQAGFFEFDDLPFDRSPYTLRIPDTMFAVGAALEGSASSPNVVGGDLGLVDATTAEAIVTPGSFVAIGGITLSDADLAGGSNRSATNLFGFYQGSVGDFVWFDLDQDGVIDDGVVPANGADERGLGLNNVVVFIDRDGDGVRSADEPRTVTGPSPATSRPGFYRFDSLPLGGAYRVTLDQSNFLPGGALEGLGNSTGTSALNSAGNQIIFLTSAALDVSPASPQDLAVDFGLTRASVGNFVWEDTNGDGIAGVGEPPVPGVRVQLYAAGPDGQPFTADDVAVGIEATTDANGAYAVPFLPGGTYYATFNLQGLDAAYRGSTVRAVAYPGVDPAGATDQNDLTALLRDRIWRTPTFAVAVGAISNGVDAALYRPVAVSGRIFFDQARDDRDSAASPEPPVAATVTLRYLGPNDAFNLAEGDFEQTATSTGGAYSFASSLNLPPGQYELIVANPGAASYAFVDADVGADDTIDSDVNPATGSTGSFSIASNSSVADLDAGFTGTTAVAGFTFTDGDRDGLSSGAADGPLDGVTVNLSHAVTLPGGTAITISRSATTDGSGAFSFDELPGGTFALSFVTPTGYVVTTADVGADNSIDSDGDAELANQTLVGGVDAARDRGYYSATVSGRVWYDVDADGTRDVGEPPLTGVSVEVVDSATSAVIDTATTAADGTYSTDGSPLLTPGSYVVRVINPSTDSLAFSTTGSDNDIRSTAGTPATTGSTAPFTLAAGAEVSGLDAGLIGARTISGKVFVDANANGQSVGDSGLAGATVNLSHSVPASAYLDALTLNFQAVTQADGLYSFRVPLGSFDLTFVQPTVGAQERIWRATTLNSGPEATDSDGDQSGVTLTTADAAIDQGYYQNALISARVFDELVTVNNSFDNGENGINGVAVVFTGPTPQSGSTGADGSLSFEVRPGDYTIAVTDPNGYSRSPGNTGGSSLTLASNAAPAAAPFGYTRSVTVGGQVWFDVDGDGARDAGEPPLSNVAVAVINAGPDGIAGNGDDVGAPLNLTTDADGAYSSAGQELPPGRYIVQVTNPSTADFAFRVGGADNEINTTSGTPATSGSTAAFTLASGASSTSRDAGLVGARTVRGRVFVDANADGQSGGDSGLAGAQVQLSFTPSVATHLSAPAYTLSATTAADGSYSFAGLPGGSFDLSFTAPAVNPPARIWRPAPLNQGDDATDSDGDQSGVALSTAEAVFDQGYYQNAVISARVFDERGVIDNSFGAGDVGIAGVSVALTGSASASGATAADGLVSFEVAPGSYTLTVPTPATYFASPGNAGSAGPTALTSGQSASAASFGYYKASTISGTAWYDSDGDGRVDAGEPGMEGIAVRLVGSAGLVDTATSGLDGSFSFANVQPSGALLPNTAYRLCFEVRPGFTFTARVGPITDDGNSDADEFDGCGSAFQVGSDRAISFVDAGYVGALTLGDFVWIDADADGLQDAGENGLGGAVVTVQFNTEGGAINSQNPSVVISAESIATVNREPNYRLDGVPPAASFMVVSVTVPTGFRPSPLDAGADDGLDSDPVAAYNRAVAADVADLDFGFYQTTTVGDRVWYDSTPDGLYNPAAEPGVPGLRVDLLRDGAPIDQRETLGIAPVGQYQFNDLTPGSYSLRFNLPPGYTFTNDGLGSPAADNDNDARLDGTTASIALASGQVRPTLDAGIVGTASLSGIAWRDLDRDGIREAAEAGRIEGVRVNLTVTTDLLGPLSFTTTTAADGSYSFANLPPGSATLSFAASPSYAPVPANAGSDDARDSDGPAVELTIGAGQAIAGVDQGYLLVGLTRYLPVVFADQLRPDLIVSLKVGPEELTAGRPASIEVTVTNIGETSASGFWVDAYINPSRVPQVNDPWNELCSLSPCFGLAWFVEGTLQPGESVTLNSGPQSATNPNGFRIEASNWRGFFANDTTKLYALVDSWNRSSAGEQRDPFGAYQERNENNNRAELDVTVARAPIPVEPDGRLSPQVTYRRDQE
jgi:hypothetical protein